jgi:hypothetical protein
MLGFRRETSNIGGQVTLETERVSRCIVHTGLVVSTYDGQGSQELHLRKVNKSSPFHS